MDNTPSNPQSTPQKFLHQVVALFLVAIITRPINAAPLYPTLNSQPSPKQEHQAAPKKTWLDDARFGTMTHYLNDWLVQPSCPWNRSYKLDPSRTLKGPFTSASWNQLINNFDVETLANQLQTAGVDYHIFTVSQCGGYYIGPNKTMDKLLNRTQKNSRQSQRDLVLELGKALHKRNIKLIVYIPHEPPIRGDKHAVDTLRPTGQINPKTGKKYTADQAWRIFSGHWENILAEYANRWGNNIDGWWFDGCWFGQMSYKDKPNYYSLLDALHSANPNAVVSFNHQHRALRGITPPKEDYFSGETNEPQQHVITSPHFGKHNIRAQMLTYLGNTWYFGNKPRFSEKKTAQITRNLTQHGGCVAWDVPITPQGTIVKSFLPHLKAIGNAAHENPITQWRKRTQGKLIPAGNIAYKRPAYLTQLKDNPAKYPQLLPPSKIGNAKHRTASQGVDGNPKTYAQAANQYPWSYRVDLQKQHPIKKIIITFDPKHYPTELNIQTSTNGKTWNKFKTFKNQKGKKIKLKLNTTLTTRWIRINATKPNAENQKGSQMAIAELQVFTK